MVFQNFPMNIQVVLPALRIITQVCLIQFFSMLQGLIRPSCTPKGNSTHFYQAAKIGIIRLWEVPKIFGVPKGNFCPGENLLDAETQSKEILPFIHSLTYDPFLTVGFRT